MVLVCPDVKDLVSHSIDIQSYMKQDGKIWFLENHAIFLCRNRPQKK